ncbi:MULTISPECIES: chorismate mutase [unclassified Gilliamella]
MNDIRAEIDRIDHLVIQLLAARFEYVKAASQFKKMSLMCRLKLVLTVC